MKKNKSVKFLTYFFIVFPAVFIWSFSAFAQSSWQLDDYNYRREMAVNNAGNFLNDFQILAIVDTYTPTAQNKMRQDCADIRFVDSGGNVLNHWIESGCGAGDTRMWVKFPVLQSGAFSIFMYYGNSSAQNTGGNIDSVMDDGLRIWYEYPTMDLNVLPLDLQSQMRFLRTAGTCVENSISHSWSGAPYISGCSSESGNIVKITWKGWVINKGSGSHSFKINSDNGATLFLDGNLIIEKNSINVMEAAGNYSFSRPVSIMLEFYKYFDNGVLALGWTPANGSGNAMPLPAANLRTNKTAFPNAEPGVNFGNEQSRLSWEESAASPESPVNSGQVYNYNGGFESSTSGQVYGVSLGEFTQKIKNVSAGGEDAYVVEAVAGDILRYVITLQSDKNFENAKIIDVLPQKTSFISASNGGIYDNANNSVKWNIGNIYGSTYNFFYEVRALSAVSDGDTIANTALFESTHYVFSSNETKFEIAAPRIIISREVLSSPNSGADLSYRIDYRNIGSRSAKINLTENYSEEIKFLRSSPTPSSSFENSVSFEIVNLAAGGSGSIMVDLTKIGLASSSKDGVVDLAKTSVINGEADYFDDHGNKYPQIVSRTEIDLGSGKVINSSVSGQGVLPSQGQVKGAMDVQAGSYESALVAFLLAVAAMFAFYIYGSTDFSKLRLRYALWKERGGK